MILVFTGFSFTSYTQEEGSVINCQTTQKPPFKGRLIRLLKDNKILCDCEIF